MTSASATTVERRVVCRVRCSIILAMFTMPVCGYLQQAEGFSEHQHLGTVHISNGHIAQVLFLSKRSIDSNDQGMRVELSDKPGAFFQIQGMYRVGERSVDKDPRTFVGVKQVSYIWA